MRIGSLGGYHQNCQVQTENIENIENIAYHTVSLAAIQVVASVITIDLLASERKYIYDNVVEREVAFERSDGRMDAQTDPRSADMDGATARGGRLLPYSILNRSRILPWPAKGVEKGGNGAVLALLS